MGSTRQAGPDIQAVAVDGHGHDAQISAGQCRPRPEISRILTPHAVSRVQEHAYDQIQGLLRP